MGIRLDEALRETDSEGATAFVADVWARSGWETSTDGATVTATRAGETRRLLVCHGESAAEDADESGGPTAAVDAVISTGDDERAAALADRYDAASIRVNDLYRRLSYGMPVEERSRVVERHFDAAEVMPPESGGRTASTRGGDDAADQREARAGPTDGADGSFASDRERGVGSFGGDGSETLGPERREAENAVPAERETTEGSDATSDETDGDVTSSGMDGGVMSSGTNDDETPGGDPATRRIVAAGLLLVLFGVGSIAALGVGPGLLASAGESTTTDGGAVEPETEDGTEVVLREAISTVAVASDRDGERRYVGLHPTCNRPPGLVVKIQLGALRQNDGSLNKGIRTVWRFASPETRRSTGPYPQFVELVNSSRYRPMFEYTRAVYEPLRIENGTARQRVTLTTPDRSTATYEFRLSKQSSGEYDGCWMTDGVTLVEDPDA